MPELALCVCGAIGTGAGVCNTGPNGCGWDAGVGRGVPAAGPDCVSPTMLHEASVDDVPGRLSLVCCVICSNDIVLLGIVLLLLVSTGETLG